MGDGGVLNPIVDVGGGEWERELGAVSRAAAHSATHSKRMVEYAEEKMMECANRGDDAAAQGWFNLMAKHQNNLDKSLKTAGTLIDTWQKIQKSMGGGKPPKKISLPSASPASRKSQE